MNAYDRMIRYKKLMSLSDVVLLGGSGVDSIRQAHLERMIHKRIDKEFLNPSSEEEEIIEGVKKNNLRFVDRTIKRHNDGEVFVQVHEDIREREMFTSGIIL